MIGTLENDLGAGINVKASDSLANQLKKFTMDMPVGMHQQLKMIAAGQQTTVRALVMEAVVEHIIPKYTREGK